MSERDYSDGDYWRRLGPREVVSIVSAELAESYADVDHSEPPSAIEVIQRALKTVGEDVQDRAIDQLHCAKADDCHATAVFLNWLAWHLDDDFLAWFEHAAQDET